MRFAIIAAAALVAVAALSGCEGYRFPGGPPQGTGTVSGMVTVVPCAPVERVNSPCHGKPAAGVALIFTSASDEQVIAQTDSAGQYAVELKAGRWAVTFKGYLRVLSGPSSVTVGAGSSVVANYLLDSGIRLPAPAAGS